MSGFSSNFEEPEYPVVTDWDDLKACPFARKCYVNPSNVDEEKPYEEGDFLRVYCDHDGRWCDAEFGCDCCEIYNDHEDE